MVAPDIAIVMHMNGQGMRPVPLQGVDLPPRFPLPSLFLLLTSLRFTFLA